MGISDYDRNIVKVEASVPTYNMNDAVEELCRQLERLDNLSDSLLSRTSMFRKDKDYPQPSPGATPSVGDSAITKSLFGYSDRVREVCNRIEHLLDTLDY